MVENNNNMNSISDSRHIELNISLFFLKCPVHLRPACTSVMFLLRVAVRLEPCIGAGLQPYHLFKLPDHPHKHTNTHNVFVCFVQLL